MNATQQPADSPKAALAQFIQELHETFHAWYDRSVRRHYRTWLPLQLITLLSGFGTSILAAIMSDAAFTDFGAGRVVLVVLPAVGSAASTIAVQARLYDRYQLRERGRLGVQALYLEGQRRFAAATTPAEYSDIHGDLESRLNLLESEQGAGFFSFLKP
jgi:hypothetical protein